MSEISVLLPDGSERRVADGTTGLELASSISRNLGKAAVAIEVDGRESDLSTSLHDGCRVRIVTSDSDEGRHVLRHSTAHVLAQAVTRLYPGAKYTIGPAIENGFYYDFSYKRPFTPEDLEAIEKKMAELARKDEPV